MTVRLSMLLSSTMGVNRSFQLQMKKKMIVSEIAGQPIGMTTCRSRPK